jgi:hypothetical protein
MEIAKGIQNMEELVDLVVRFFNAAQKPAKKK